MSGFVLDASMALAWCFEDEATPVTDSVLQRLAQERARVPTLWHLEVANAFAGAERRGRLAPADTGRAIALLAELPVDVDSSTSARAFRETIVHARAHGLTVYDAAYLELALREGLALATLDGPLAKAARVLGVEVVGAGGSG